MQTMKTSLFIIGMLIVIALGYYFFMMPTSMPTIETPTDTSSNVRLNIDTICEGALAYMTFPSGAAAEAFVQECKNGEHPEVIEQWKIQMGITDDRAI